MVRGSFDGERVALERRAPVPEPAGAAARRPALEPARALHRGGRRAARARRPPARRRGRHVGRRLRAARSAGRRARAAVPLPRLAHRGHDRPRGRACPTGGALRGDRHPDDADQHGLPAARRLQGGGRGADRPRPGSARLLALRRARQRGHQRLHHRPPRRAVRHLGARADRAARPACRAVRRRPGGGRHDARAGPLAPWGRRARARRGEPRHGLRVRRGARARRARGDPVLGHLVAARARARPRPC